MAEAEAEAEVEEEEVEELKLEELDDTTTLKELDDELEGFTTLDELDDVVEVLELLPETLTVWLKSYRSSLFGPPQNSDRLPLQGILHPVKPSGAGPPPLEKTLPQSMKQEILRIIRKMHLMGKWVERETYSTLWRIQHQREYIPPLRRRMCRDQHSYWPLRPGQQYRL
jgi:hypothetical protein